MAFENDTDLKVLVARIDERTEFLCQQLSEIKRTVTPAGEIKLVCRERFEGCAERNHVNAISKHVRELDRRLWAALISALFALLGAAVSLLKLFPLR